MGAVFLKLLNMSITASWLILAVVLLRLLLTRAPKWLRGILWAMVALRLLIPFSFESTLSLLPTAEPIPSEILYSAPPIESASPSDLPDFSNSPETSSPDESLSPTPDTPVDDTLTLNEAVNSLLTETLPSELAENENPVLSLTRIAALLWLAGLALLLIYTLISYLRIRRQVAESFDLQDGILLCDRISTPFIIGIFRPRIFLPSTINDADIPYVLAHERAHLKRLDYIWKPLSFLILAVYWFNPFIWLAYILFCRDIELACDEKVIRQLGIKSKKPYSDALINCSLPRRMISACPLAFGEGSIKSRIKSVLNYKKPTLWIIIASMILCAAAAVFFLTDPPDYGSVQLYSFFIFTDKNSNSSSESPTELDGLSLELISYQSSVTAPILRIGWNNQSAYDISFGDEFYLYREEDGEWVDCRTTEYYWDMIAYLAPMEKITEKDYMLFDMEPLQAGHYRFESRCRIDSMEEPGASPETFAVSLEFELTEEDVTSESVDIAGGISALKVDQVTITEIRDDVLVVEAVANGYIQCNNAALSSSKHFCFTVNTASAYSVGDVVTILHTGDFSIGELPTATPVYIEKSPLPDLSAAFSAPFDEYYDQIQKIIVSQKLNDIVTEKSITDTGDIHRIAPLLLSGRFVETGTLLSVSNDVMTVIVQDGEGTHFKLYLLPSMISYPEMSVTLAFSETGYTYTTPDIYSEFTKLLSETLPSDEISDNQNKTPPNHTPQVTDPTVQRIDPWTIITEKKLGAWYVKPTFDFDDMILIDRAFPRDGATFTNPGDVAEEDFYRLALFTKDGKNGVVDQHGNIVHDSELAVTICPLCGLESTSLQCRLGPRGEVYHNGIVGHGLPSSYGYDVTNNRLFNLAWVSPPSNISNITFPYPLMLDAFESTTITNGEYSAYQRYEPMRYILIGTDATPVSNEHFLQFHTLSDLSSIPEHFGIPYYFEQFQTDIIAVQTLDGSWKFIDTKGNDLNIGIFEEAFTFHEGVAAVKKDGKWGFIDQSGKTLIPFIYEDATSVYDGLAWVKQEGFWGVLQVFDE
ncbi:MAG: hypothetical protein E7487_00705 [Ruminococcaceae bacterium]|nr:hypothetical protein [Oscillospiraceae bacterium]